MVTHLMCKKMPMFGKKKRCHLVETNPTLDISEVGKKRGIKHATVKEPQKVTPTDLLGIWVFSEMSFPRIGRLVHSDGGPLLIQFISDACVSSR